MKSQKYPFVSVVIPAHNEENFIGKALRSLQKQDYKGKYEVIVVDNASTDNTAKIARKYGARVIYEPRKGVQYARQAGFESAYGEFIASTDADDVMPTNWLSRMSQRLVENPSLVAVGGWIYHETGPLLSKFAINHISGSFVIFYQKISRKAFLVGQNFIVRKSAFQKTEGFKNVPAYCEDLNFARRLSKIGKIEFNTTRDWCVVASPRRWNQGFLAGFYPYFLNGISWAIAGKVVVKNLKIIRIEKK